MAIDFMEFLPQITSFLFVFAIVYALLIFTGIFSATRRAAALLSIVIAFFAVMYSPLVSFLQGLLPIASIILVILFFIVFVKKLFIKEDNAGTTRDSLPLVVLLAISLILIGIFWNELSFMPFGLSSETVLWLVGVLIIILIFLAVYSHKQPEKQ